MLWMTDEIQRRLLLTLAHFLWQASAVAVALIAMTTVFRIQRPTARYAASLLAFAVMAASPVATWLLIPFEPVPVAAMPIAASPIIDAPLPSDVMLVESGSVLIPGSIHPASAAIDIEPAPEAERPLLLEGMRRTVAFPAVRTWREVLRIAEPYIIGVWLAGVCVLSLRLLLGAMGIRRWRRRGQIPAEELLAVVKRICEVLGMAMPLVRVSGQVGEAVAVGLLRPMILLPASWLTELPPDMLEAVLAHELAHLRRLDLWVNLMQRIVETLLFYHPVVWWLSRRLRNERELCCDALAVEVTRDPLRYAETLEHVARLHRAAEALRLAVAFHPVEGTLTHRIRQLLEPVPPAVSGTAWLAGCVTLILVLAIPVSAFVTLRSDRQSASDEAAAVVHDTGDDNAPEADFETTNAPVDTALPDWPQWGRGPHRNNVATAKVPAVWDLERGTNVAWSAQLGTATYSSPVVAGGKVFIGTNNGAALNSVHPASQDLACLVCFDQATGKLLWQYASGKLPTGRMHDWPNIGLCSTACVHGDRVWVVTNRCEVVCLDANGFRDGKNDGPFRAEPAQTELEGDVVWKFDVFGELGVRPLHQAVSSITHVDGVLLLNTSNGPDESHQKVPAPHAPNFLALEAATGRVLWTDNSAGESIIVGGSSCSCSGPSPAVATIHGVRQAIFAGKEGWVYGYSFDDLKQGRTTRLWQFDCNPKTARYELGGRGRRNTVMGSPVVWNSHIYVATGRNPEQLDGEADLWCIDPSKRGDISSELVFNKSFENGEKPIPHKPYCACEEDKGDFTRPNPNSGAVWHYSSQDRDSDGQTGFEETFHRALSSPVIHNRLLFIADTSGLLHCLDAKPSASGQPVVHWTHDLQAACWSTPLIADGRVYVGDEDGDVVVFALSAQKKLLAENVLDAQVYSTLCAANNTLFVATQKTLAALALAGLNGAVAAQAEDQSLKESVQIDAEWSAEQGGLRTRLSLDSEKPAVGELKIRFEVQNVSSRKLGWRILEREIPQFFQITDPDGRLAKNLAEDCWLYGRPLVVNPRWVEPGESVVFLAHYDLSQFFFLPKAGRYEVRFGRTREGEIPGKFRTDGDDITPLPEPKPLVVTLADGKLPDLQELGIRLLRIAPEGWTLAVPQSLGKQPGLLLMPPGFRQSREFLSLGFRRDDDLIDLSKVKGPGLTVVDFGPTACGHAYFAGLKDVEAKWPGCVDQIRAELMKDNAARESADGRETSTDRRSASRKSQHADQPHWGPVTNGLRARVVPALAAMSEDAVDLTQAVTTFETPDDVALAVEIENVSDRPLPVRELRYGANYGDSKGRLASDWFGQFLFSINYFDAAGAQLARPELIPVGKEIGMSDGALTATLEPKQSVKMLLRPNRWISALSQQPLIGRQRAVVRYRGATANNSDEVVAPVVEFTVTKRGYRPSGVPAAQLGDDPQNDPEREPDITKQLAWGEPVNGLRTALDVIPESRLKAFSHGTKAKLKLHVQNVSDQTVTLASLMWLSELPVKATDANGQSIEIRSTWYSGITPVVRVRLKPRQVIVFDAGNLGLAVTKERAEKFEHVTHRTLVASRGRYTLQATERFGTSFQLKDGDGNVLVPAEGDFKGDLTTGPARLDLSNEVIECEIVDAVTGQPVEGTTVNFIVSKPKSASADEQVVAHMAWGPKAPARIYFTIPEVPEDIAQRPDRDELEVRFGVGGHPDYEDFSSPARIPLRQFFHEGPQAARDVLSRINLTPKKAMSGSLPRAGLEFLNPYPKLHALSIEMTESQFLEILKRQKLKTRKTVADDQTTHHIVLDDGHTLIVMFNKDATCRGIQRVRNEGDSERVKNSNHAGEGLAIPESDPLAKYGDQLVVSWLHAGDHRSPDETVRVVVLRDGTVKAAGDTNRNRDCEIKLTAAQLEQLLKELDETDQCFDLVPDGQHLIRPGEPYNRWDRSADWIQVRRGRQEVRIGCIYGWVTGTAEQIPGAVIHRNVLTRLRALISVARAGGWDEIERLVPIANKALLQTFPQLPSLNAKDFASSERFFYPARSIDFRRQKPDGEHFGVELELRDDGTVNPVSAWNGEDVRDLDRPPVVRGLDLSNVPVTKEWKEMEKLRVRTDQGYSFKPEYESHEVGPELWLCYLPNEKKFFIEHSDNQRRKLYGPIVGDPYVLLNPPPVRHPWNIEKADSKQTSRQTLSAPVQSFNVENRQLARGLDQPPLTEEEVIAVIQREQWKPELQPLNGEEIAAFKDVGRTGLLPKDAYLQVYDDEQPEPFRVRHLWQIRLMLPAIGHDGFVGLTIRDTLVREETIEPSAVAWGEPDADGLQLGAYLTPKKDRYAVGERVRLRLLVCNHGSQAVKTTWANTSHPMPDDFRVTDETGAGVAVRIGHRSWDLPWISGYEAGGLAPGEIHTLRVPYEISLGGDGSSNKLIGRVIDAKPGQTLRLTVREHNGSERAKVSGATAAESGVIELTMQADQPAVSDVDSNGEIHGRLLDEQGQPVAGAAIACGAVLNDSGQGGGANTITDANGLYRLKVPSPGIYTVWLKRHESPQMTAVADDGLLVEGGKVTASQMVLSAGTSISGTLMDAQDRPLPNENVYCHSLARPQSGATVMSTTTNDKGVFTFTLPPGRAVLYAMKAVPESAGVFGSGSVHADVVISVPLPGEAADPQEPLKLKLLARGVPFGSDEWVRRSTPGTQVVRHGNAVDVTGTVVDTAGQPVSGAKVFRYDGPIVAASEKGEFKVTAPKGTQFILHAFAPGYHLWFGAPTAGDVLKVVLEKKATGRIVTPIVRSEDIPQKEADAEFHSFEIRLVGGPKLEPLPDVLVKITQGYGSQQKVFGPYATRVDGTLRCTLPPGDFELHLKSDREWPYLPVDAAWDKATRQMTALHLRVTSTGVEKWVREKLQPDGIEPAKGGSPARVTFTLLPATELILRAVDVETGQGLAGAEFYQENAVGEDWAHRIFSQNLGSKFERDTKLPVDVLHTGSDGRFRRLVGANADFKYGVAIPPTGYEAVDPGREIELPILYGQLRAEHTFQFRRATRADARNTLRTAF